MGLSISRSKAVEGQARLSSRYGIRTRVDGDGHLVAAIGDEDKIDHLVDAVPERFAVVRKDRSSIIIRVK